MKTSEIREGDMVTYRNGRHREITKEDYEILKKYYDENLRCINNEEYSIVKVQRRYYNTIYSREITHDKKVVANTKRI